jgi:hypothetical protein
MLPLYPRELSVARELFGINSDSQSELYVCQADFKRLKWVNDNRTASCSFASAAGMLVNSWVHYICSFIAAEVCGMPDSHLSEEMPADIQVDQ